MPESRELLIAGNWKMNENHFESLKLVQELAALLRAEALPGGRTVSIHPPFTSIRTVQVALETDRIPLVLGAQDCHTEERGAFTGEVSAEMLAKLNVRAVIVGHSERRRLLGEGDELIRRKVDAVLRHEMTPILCVGEDGAEREAGRHEEVVNDQLRAALARRAPEVLAGLVVAYEPVWAIGTGLSATAADAQAMAACIRAGIAAFDAEAAGRTRILYGGSVTEDNAAELLGQPDVDGLLVGGASLDAKRFCAIARAGV